MNNINLIGNVASKPASDASGDVAFSLAVRRSDTTDTVDTFIIRTRGEQAKMAKHYVEVGRRVAIEGSVLPNGSVTARIIHLLGKAR